MKIISEGIAFLHSINFSYEVSSSRLSNSCSYYVASNIWLSPIPSPGRLWNTSARYLLFDTIDLQCLACRLDIGGSLGSNVVAKTGFFVFVDVCFLFKAAFLGTCFALSIGESILFC